MKEIPTFRKTVAVKENDLVSAIIELKRVAKSKGLKVTLTFE